MARSTVNAAFMTPENEAIARTGMLDVQPKELHPGYELFRFATRAYPYDWVTNGWWIGFSPNKSVEQRAGRDEAKLSAVAREATAVFIDPSKPLNAMDVLLSARVKRPLSAWTGRPKTVTPSLTT